MVMCQCTTLLLTQACSEHLMDKIKSHLNLVEAEKKRDLFQSMVQDMTSELRETEVKEKTL